MSEKIYSDLPAPPLLTADREGIADRCLALLPNYRGGPIDIVEIVRSAGVSIIELTRDKMGDNEAFARPQVNSIFVRPGFKDELKRKLPETLFKLAHEFAHVVLHRGALAKPLKLGGNVSLGWLRPGEGQEDQAWDLARAIMLPRSQLHDHNDILRTAADFNAPPIHVSEIGSVKARTPKKDSTHQSPTP
jgi:Zn-dependent peptidase ImmA (M78 family)